MNKRFGGILSESLYCVVTLLDARYKDLYFDADKKQGLREMLQTQLHKMETDTVTVRTEEERPQTDRACQNKEQVNKERKLAVVSNLATKMTQPAM